MTQLRVAAERTIPQPPSTLYAILRDYRTHHRRILPESFQGLEIEQGGLGAGTIFTIELKAGGRVRRYRMEVEEPQPGHRMIERDLNSSLVTAFNVMPASGGSIVRIETTWTGAKGIGGFFEKLFAPRAMRSLYVQELENLEAYAATNPL